MRDSDAFVFNMESKFIPNNPNRGIFTDLNGFSFGNFILTLTGDLLNAPNAGQCKTGNQNHYNIEGDASPLTKEEDNFTCAKLEVFKVVF